MVSGTLRMVSGTWRNGVRHPHTPLVSGLEAEPDMVGIEVVLQKAANPSVPSCVVLRDLHP